MSKHSRSPVGVLAFWCLLPVLAFCLSGHAAEPASPIPVPKIFGPSDEAEKALKTLRPAPGLKADLFAAEPSLVNPVAFCLDEQGRVYVVETFRRIQGAVNIEGRVDWENPAVTKLLGEETVADYMLSEDLACTTFDENLAFLRRHLQSRFSSLAGLSERVRLIVPDTRNGKGAISTVFAEGFDQPGDGIAAGILAREGRVLFGCIPKLWELRDREGRGVATEQKSLQHGYGVHLGTASHSLHGFKIGPDGKLYLSMGDRGASVRAWDGSHVENPDSGAVFRCNLDGSALELFATGLRNPQSLAFDQFGNLFTGDNNSDGGDPSRWVYVVEGGDSGWRAGYQYFERPPDAELLRTPPKSRGAWQNEGYCFPQFEGQAAFLVPPIANIGNGPSGLIFYPGVGLPEHFNNHFFLCDFKGSAANSLIHSLAVEPQGAGFRMIDQDVLVSNALPTDIAFGPDCRIYFSDWVNGWPPPGKGRLYRLFDESLVRSALVLQTQKLVSTGMQGRPTAELVNLLSHPDQRVRQEAQFALVKENAAEALHKLLHKSSGPIARIHAIWALGQMYDQSPNSALLEPVLPLLKDEDPEIVAQAAKILGNSRFAPAFNELVTLCGHTNNPRGQFFAALGLGKLRRKEAVPALFDMLRANEDRDPFLRHAGVTALVSINDLAAILGIFTAHDRPAVRMASLLALRRLHRPEVGRFLRDPEPAIVVEAARAINDASIDSALPELAELLPTRAWIQLPAGPGKGANLRTPFLRRAVNANFRLGDFQNAKALADFAEDSAAPEEIRVEALQGLGHWEKPSPREAITGLYRPLPPRDSTVAAEALRRVLPSLVGDGSIAVRVAAARLAGQYRIAEAEPALTALVRDTTAPSRVRVESLKALGKSMSGAALAELLKTAGADPAEDLRIEAARLQAHGGTGTSLETLSLLLAKGSLLEQQNALALIGTLDDSRADAVLARELDRLQGGALKPELQLDLLQAAERRSSPLLEGKIAQYRAATKNDELAPYKTALAGGKSSAGRKIFFEKSETACLRCHRVGAEGSDVGPNLTAVGSRLNREKLLESIVFPNKQIAQGFETTIISLKDGATQAGILKNENEEEMTINTVDSGLLKIRKADVARRDRGLSGMPEGLGNVLSREELRDLVEFLAAQR